MDMSNEVKYAKIYVKNEKPKKRKSNQMVTICMMMETLSDCIFQYTPVFREKKFSALVLLDEAECGTDDFFVDVAAQENDSDVLYVCSCAVARTLCQKAPRMWMLGIASMDALELPSLPSDCRLTYVRSKNALPNVYLRLQRLFLKMERWQNETYKAILADEGFQKILDIAEGVFNNYISLSNANFELVARTKHIAIDDPKALELIEKGRHSESTIALFRASGAMEDWEHRSRIQETPPLLSGYPTLDYVYKRRGRYYMHLIMHCNNTKVSLGLADQFKMLVDLVGLNVKQSMESDVFAANELSLLMEDVMLHREVTTQKLERRAQAAGISIAKEKRLAVFGFSDTQYNQAYLSYYARSVAENFPWCEVGIYGSFVVALGVWENDAASSIAAFEEFAEANPCLVGISNAFTAISDLSLAFRQGKMVLEKIADDRPSLAGYYTPRAHHAVFLFEENFALCIMDTVKKDDLVRLSAQRGIVMRIARFDKQNGTNDLRILFTYLKNERDARVTSEELFIHRSTLLYRIRRMENRFGFDLDDCKVRQRLTLEFYLCESSQVQSE